MFDAEKELAEIKKIKKLVRKKRYSRSRLDKYKDELLALRKAGGSISDLQRWLRLRRVKVAWSTVQRWIKLNG